MHVARPGGARLLDQRAEDALVAGEGAGVRGGSRGAGRRGADLEHGDPDAALGARRERLGQAGAVAVALEVEGDRAELLLAAQGLDPAGRIDGHRVAARHDGVEAQPAARVQGVHGDVAALRDERHAPWLEGPQRVAPEGGALVQSHDPVAVRAAQRQLVAERHPRRARARSVGAGGRPPRSPRRRPRRRRSRARRPRRPPPAHRGRESRPPRRRPAPGSRRARESRAARAPRRGRG